MQGNVSLCHFMGYPAAFTSYHTWYCWKQLQISDKKKKKKDRQLNVRSQFHTNMLRVKTPFSKRTKAESKASSWIRFCRATCVPLSECAHFQSSSNWPAESVLLHTPEHPHCVWCPRKLSLPQNTEDSQRCPSLLDSWTTTQNNATKIDSIFCGKEKRSERRGLHEITPCRQRSRFYY